MLAGDLIATGMVGLFFALCSLIFLWVLSHRQLQELEQKFKLLEDDDETVNSIF